MLKRLVWIITLLLVIAMTGCEKIPAEKSDVSKKSVNTEKNSVTKSGLKKDAVVVFAGDSITDGGRDLKDNLSLGANHPKLFSDYMKKNFPDEKITVYNTGIRGDRLLDFYFRMDKDCINLKPDYIVLYLGVNEAWVGRRKENFEKTYRILLETLTSKTKAKIILVEPFLLPANEEMKKACVIANVDTYIPKVLEYTDVVRKVAAEKKLPLIFYSEILEQAHKGGMSYQSLSPDAIHLTSLSAKILTDQILQKLEIKGYKPEYSFDLSSVEALYQNKKTN